MKNFIIASVLLYLFGITNKLKAQESESTFSCHLQKTNFALKNTIADTAENFYDIKYVKLNLSMTNDTTSVSGNVITKAKVVTTAMNRYVFELIPALTIDSVLVNGINCVVSTLGDVRTATLAISLPYGTMFTAQVFYHGTPPSGVLPATNGINTLISPSWGARATYTLSESYHAKEWWPCKQSLQDKIDSSDFWITVADSLKAGSNGILNAVTTIDSNHVRYEWKQRKPIDYYLISASVSNYIDYSYYMHFTGSTDSMLVQNYIYTNPATLTYYKSVIDSTGMMIDYFSQIYGRYPFWHEKYGHCIAPLWGGMEHQTMTTCGSFSGALVSHELSHQWFGDNVTCRTWSNIFVNEGIASYSEDVYYDRFNSHIRMINDIRSKQADVLNYDTGTIVCPDTSSEARIFDGRLSYHKGACVLHILRFAVNNDSLFFTAYRQYQSQLGDSTATINDFKNTFKTVCGTVVNGINIDTFFNQWFFLQGYPKYTVTWNQIDTDVFVKFIQSGAVPSSVPFFTLPVDITLHSLAADTVLRVLNNIDTQIYHFTWHELMTNLYFDSSYWLLYKLNGAIVKDTNLNFTTLMNISNINNLTIYPNPTCNNWQVYNIPVNSVFALFDINGKEVMETTNAQANTLIISTEHLSNGIYFLKTHSKEGDNKVYKLLKY